MLSVIIPCFVLRQGAKGYCSALNVAPEAAQKELKLDVGDDAVTAFMYVPASVRALRRPESVKKLSHT